MDIFSHGLWAGAAFSAANKKFKKPLNVWSAVFWGALPDLFAFTIPFVWMFWNVAVGDLSISDLPHPNDVEPAARGAIPIFSLTSALYNIGHSAVVFFLVFGAVHLVFRRPVWEMGGWLIHILLDIPTHSYAFYPTPFLWPLFDWKFDGFSWGTMWFLVPNYAAIAIVYFFLARRKKRKKTDMLRTNTK